ncbi:MAG: hypothetical protein JO170_32025 [Verrucomicrobia bacterium]|nr:hypothetical protein [Verrucomicrobiota bacterium]
MNGDSIFFVSMTIIILKRSYSASGMLVLGLRLLCPVTIITMNGTHSLTYEVTAAGFPDLKVVMLVTLGIHSHEPEVQMVGPRTLALN